MSRNAGIILIAVLFSRLFGLAREKFLAIFLGNSLYADAFKAAMRIPNLHTARLSAFCGGGVHAQRIGECRAAIPANKPRGKNGPLAIVPKRRRARDRVI